MDFFLKLLTVIGSIVVPIFIALWNSKNSIRKHPKEEYADDVNIAEKFATAVSTNQPMLVKDRLTQQLLETKKITYFEVMYFYEYCDMEKWVNRYISVRDELKLVRNSKGQILKIHYPNARKRRVLFGLGYICFAIVGLLPFLFINWYTETYSNNLDSKQYLVVFNLIIWPFLSLILALICLIAGIKCKDAKKFMENFETEAIKI